MTEQQVTDFIQTLEVLALERVDICDNEELDQLAILFSQLEVVLGEITKKLRRSIN